MTVQMAKNRIKLLQLQNAILQPRVDQHNKQCQLLLVLMVGFLVASFFWKPLAYATVVTVVAHALWLMKGAEDQAELDANRWEQTALMFAVKLAPRLATDEKEQADE